MEALGRRVAAPATTTHRPARVPVRRASLCLLAMVLAPASAGAQSALGTIRGRLVDDLGDPLPMATIRVVDESTGIQRESETTASGDYEFPNLRAGAYRIEDGSPGFAAFQRTGVVLSTGDTAHVDLRLGNVILGTLAPGASTQPVAVRAEELVISAEGGANIQLDSPAIQIGIDRQRLSTLPRSPLEFSEYLFLTPNVLGAGESGARYLSGRSYGVEFLQDGQPGAAQAGGRGRAGAGLYAIDEIKVFSNSYGAEFGGLAAVVVTTRRGGNQLSGGAFYDFNADELNALAPAERRRVLERGSERSDTQEHRYGAWLGGPIHKQKTFFFLNYQRLTGSSVRDGNVVFVPTEKMRRGDFSELQTTLIDPESGEPFPGNVIPPERLDPAALRILDFFYQLPNLPPLSTNPGPYQESVNVRENHYRVDARLDHELSATDSVFARFTWGNQDPGTALLDPSLPQLGTQPRNSKSRILATSWVHIFSSRALNELRGGWTSAALSRRTPFVVGDVADRLGIEVPDTARPLFGLPSFSFPADQVADIPSTPEASFQDENRSTLSFGDTFTWLLDRHSFKLGGLYSQEHDVDGFSLDVNAPTGRVVFRDDAGYTGNALADLLLGRPEQSVAGTSSRGGPLDVTSRVFAAFAQDDWKVSRRLTLFLGLRYEIDLGFRERRNLLVNLDPEGQRLVVPDLSIAPQVTNTSLPIVVAEQVGVGRTLIHADAGNLAPRLGFAYRLDEDRTVVRGGAGLFYPDSTVAGIRELLSRTAFQSTTTRNGPILSRAFSTGKVEPPARPEVNAIPFTLESPEFLQYHLTLERELPGNFGVRASFLGAHAEKLLVNRLINTLPASTVRFDPAQLPFPTLATTIRKLENTGTGSFNALQLEVARRWHAGLGIHLAYTLSHTRTLAPDGVNSASGTAQYDPYDLDKNLGPDPYIPRHRFILDATWNVPVGRGRSVQALPRWLDALLGGWTVSTLVQARSGTYLTPFYMDDGGRARGGTAPRPDLVGDPSGPRARDNWFNLGAFSRPAPGTIGNAPSGAIEGPGTWVGSLGLYKDVVSGSRFAAQLRVTLDNAFNHPQFVVDPGANFVNLTDYLNEKSNETTNVLTSGGNADGFASSRVIRIGLQLRF